MVCEPDSPGVSTASEALGGAGETGGSFGRGGRALMVQPVHGKIKAMKVVNLSIYRRELSAKPEGGFTLMELIIAATIMSILTMMVLPMARLTIQRQKEKELRHALWQMRDAIDNYKQASERGAFQIKADSGGYPPDLETLVKGVEAQGGQKMRFLRSIPIDPMTRSKEWGLRSMQDDPDSDSWGGQSVFDVYTKSEGTGLDGTKYKDW